MGWTLPVKQGRADPGRALVEQWKIAEMKNDLFREIINQIVAEVSPSN